MSQKNDVEIGGKILKAKMSFTKLITLIVIVFLLVFTMLNLRFALNLGWISCGSKPVTVQTKNIKINATKTLNEDRASQDAKGDKR